MRPDEPLRPTLWRTCRVLANRRRLRVLQLLAGGREWAVTAVARQLEIATPVASQSLRALEARGLLVVRRRGGRVYYRWPSATRHATLGPGLRALRAGFRRDPGFGETAFRDATAFTHPRRLEVYRAIVAGQHHAVEIRAATHVSRFALARHLAKLESRGLVRRERGQWVTTQPADTFAAALVRLAVS